MKDRECGFITRPQFVNYCWRENKITLKDRFRELEELQQMISGTSGIERLNYLFPFGNSDQDVTKRD
jgi:hypothetical protein